MDRVKGQLIDPKHLQHLRQTVDLKNAEIAVPKEKLTHFESKIINFQQSKEHEFAMEKDSEDLAKIREDMKDQLQVIKTSNTALTKFR